MQRPMSKGDDEKELISLFSLWGYSEAMQPSMKRLLSLFLSRQPALLNRANTESGTKVYNPSYKLGRS